MLVVAGLPVVLTPQHAMVTSSLLIPSPPSHTCLCVQLESSYLSHYNLKTQHHHYAINTEGLFNSAACHHVFVFLNGAQNVTQGLHREPVQNAHSLVQENLR